MKRVLLVEDNREIAGMLFDYFECAGMQLDYADNGELGLKLAILRLSPFALLKDPVRSGTIVSCSEISDGAADSCSVSAEAMVDSLFPVVGNRLRRFAPGMCLLVWTSGIWTSDGTDDVA